MNTKYAPLSVGVLVPILMVSLLMAPFSAHAQTTTSTAQMQAQIQALLQQIIALQTQLGQNVNVSPGVPTGYSFTRNLSLGMNGEDVRMLQRILNSDPTTRVAASGPGSVGNETTYFRPMTRDAVIRFQNRYRQEVLSPLGLASGTGMVGPATRTKLNQLTTQQVAVPPTTPTTPTAPVLSGGEGDIEVSNNSDNSYEVRLGSVETVYEVEVEAIDSDIAVNRVDFLFGARPHLYFDEVRLKIDGKVVATLNDSTSNFTAVGNNYRARFANLNAIVREGQSVDMELEVKVKSALSGTRVNDTVTVQIPDRGIRMVDASTMTGYAPDGAALSSSAIKFQDTSGTATLNVNIDSASPKADTFLVDAAARTTVENILQFKVAAKDQSLTVNDVSLRIKTGQNDVSQVINRVRLYAGNTLVGTQTVSSGSGERTVTFTNINRQIARNSDTTFRVSVEAQRANQFTTPNTIEVKVHEVRAEDSGYASVVRSNLQVGQGVAHNLITSGATAKEVSKTATAQANDTIGRFTFTFDVRAFGNTFYVSETGLQSIVATTTLGTSEVIAISVDSNATLTSNGNYRLLEGQSRRFTVEVITANATAAGLNHVTVTELIYGTADTATVSGAASMKLGSPEYRSPTVFLVAS